MSLTPVVLLSLPSSFSPSPWLRLGYQREVYVLSPSARNTAGWKILGLLD